MEGVNGTEWFTKATSYRCHTSGAWCVHRDSTQTFTEGTAMLLWQIATVSLIPFHVKSATKCSFHDAISVLHYTANTVYSQWQYQYNWYRVEMCYRVICTHRVTQHTHIHAHVQTQACTQWQIKQYRLAYLYKAKRQMSCTVTLSKY